MVIARDANNRSKPPEAWVEPASWIAALLSLGAAGVHFAVVPEHFNEYWVFGWFFVAVAWCQAAWALVVVGDHSRGIAATGLVGNAVLVLIWLFTRTVGVPLGPAAGETETFSVVDGLAVVLEIAAIGVCALFLYRPRSGLMRGSSLRKIAVAAFVLAIITGVIFHVAGGPASDAAGAAETHGQHR